MATYKPGAFVDTKSGRAYPLGEKNFRAVVLRDFPALLKQYEEEQKTQFEVKQSYVKTVNQAYFEERWE